MCLSLIRANVERSQWSSFSWRIIFMDPWVFFSFLVSNCTVEIPSLSLVNFFERDLLVPFVCPYSKLYSRLRLFKWRIFVMMCFFFFLLSSFATNFNNKMNFASSIKICFVQSTLRERESN